MRVKMKKEKKYSFRDLKSNENGWQYQNTGR